MEWPARVKDQRLARARPIGIQRLSPKQAGLFAYSEGDLYGGPAPLLVQHGQRLEDHGDAGFVVAAEDGCSIAANHSIFDYRADPDPGRYGVHVRAEQEGWAAPFPATEDVSHRIQVRVHVKCTEPAKQFGSYSGFLS